MPIKISKKKVALSNKTQTLGKITPQAPPKAATAQKGVSLSTLFIDKISLVLAPANEEDAALIHSNIWTQFNDTSVFQSCGKPTGGFKTAKLIALPTTTVRPRFDYAHFDLKATKLRFEFNPRKRAYPLNAHTHNM